MNKCDAKLFILQPQIVVESLHAKGSLLKYFHIFCTCFDASNKLAKVAVFKLNKNRKGNMGQGFFQKTASPLSPQCSALVPWPLPAVASSAATTTPGPPATRG